MGNDKITITEKLRFDIIERRKSKGLSSYQLSACIGNGHSKFWLQNIESGKTKKITKQDLVSIYMALDEDDEESAISDIECILNQSIGSSYKQWYELINISKKYDGIYDDDDLMAELYDLLQDKIFVKIQNTVVNMPINQKQAILTTLEHLYYSLYKNPDLAFALMNIPVYGVNNADSKEHNAALNDLLMMSAKYNDLVIKNKSMDIIETWNKYDQHYEELNKQTIHTAFKNFKKILLEILESREQDNPDLYELSTRFNTDVSFIIERGQPNALKNYLKSFRIYDGKDFVKHIKECYDWFCGFQDTYEINDLHKVIPANLLDSVYSYLINIGEIKPL